MQLNLVHKFLPSFFWGAMTPWAQLALIGTNHRLTTNSWVGKTLSGRDCCNKRALNYQKGHLWISPTPLPWMLRVLSIWWDSLPKSSLQCVMMWRYFCPSDGAQFTNVLLDVEILFVLWGETQFTNCQRALQCSCFQVPGTKQQQCTVNVKCGPFATWDLAIDIRQQCFVFVLLKDIKLPRLNIQTLLAETLSTLPLNPEVLFSAATVEYVEQICNCVLSQVPAMLLQTFFTIPSEFGI